jgi:hypothetical protein
MGFRMKSHPQLIFAAGLFLVIFAGLLSNQPTVADPMTGGNPPYEDVAPPCETSCYLLPPRCPWYFQVDALALRRDPYGRINFATLGPIPPAGTDTNVALSTSALDRDFKAGVRFLFGHTFGDSPYSVEGSYFRIDNWDTSAEVRDLDNNNLFSPFRNFGNPPLPGFDRNHLISVHDFSKLQNGELNVKYMLPMYYNGFRASFLAGVRYISVEERLEYQSFTNIPIEASQVLQTRTANDLVGPQIGGYFEFFTIYHSWVSFEAKGAICGNNAVQTTRDDDHTPALVSSNQVATAFVGDLELMFNWQITKHCITRFGYQAMWVDGLALARRNLGPAGTALEVGPINTFGIDTAGETVYHGPHLGIEIVW